MVPFINPANRAPGVHTGPAPGASWEKHKKILLLQNHKLQSFHILFVAMYSVSVYKSCQPCPWGPYGPRPGGIMGKTLKDLLLRNHKAQSFHILFLATYSGYLYKSCQLCPRGPYGPRPGASWEKHKKIFFSETIWPRAFIYCVDQCIILSFINAAKGALGSIQATPQACHYLP